MKIVVLISNIGTGTNLQAIIDGVLSGKIKAKIASVISDTPDALGINRAKKYNIEVKICPKKEELLPLLKVIKPDFICLAGWKQIILDEVIDAFPNEQAPSFGSRILNTHPGLIPDTMDGVVRNPDGTIALWNKGKMANKAIQNFLDSSVSYAGCTNHFLSHEFDFGPVLGRCFEKIKPGDTVESLYTRLKVKENQLYVDVLAKLSTFTNTIMVVDGGGRGAALVDKYGQSKRVGKILVIPGNDLMQINTKKPVVTYQYLKTTSIKEILEICKKEQVDLVDVAQDNAVEAGLADTLLAEGIKVVGPTKKAGQLEWDKAWARGFMKKYQIPYPLYHVFSSTKDGIKFVNSRPEDSWFVKASGLAEGKGAIPAKNGRQAIDAIKQMARFGKSGETYLLEQWLIGEEFSAFALCDGENFQVVGFAQDHKQVFDTDLGPNTGGMGCVSNPLIVDENIRKEVEEIFKKAVDGLKKEGRAYKGVLYLGGMVVEGKVFVIEFNARWGDPEAEVILPSIKNDLYEVGQDIINGTIGKLNLKIDKKVRVVAAAAAKGYPVDYQSVKGKKVFGIDQAIKAGAKIYGAGIKKVDEDWVVAGGRILFVMAEGKNAIEARKRAYQALRKVSIEGNNLHFRKDIGWRDVERMRNPERSRRIKKDKK